LGEISILHRTGSNSLHFIAESRKNLVLLSTNKSLVRRLGRGSLARGVFRTGGNFRGTALVFYTRSTRFWLF
jgi:hypothetical protein